MRLFLVALSIMFTVSASAVSLASLTMLNAVTVTGSSERFTPWSGQKVFYANGTTTAGAGAATIIIEGSGVNSTVTGNWVTLGTITLTLGTVSTSDGFPSSANWKYVRARVSAISGTNGTVSVYMASPSN